MGRVGQLALLGGLHGKSTSGWSGEVEEQQSAVGKAPPALPLPPDRSSSASRHMGVSLVSCLLADMRTHGAFRAGQPGGVSRVCPCRCWLRSHTCQ
jgi:hypothetical protein